VQLQSIVTATPRPSGRFSPVLCVAWRELAPGDTVTARHHAHVDIVTIMLSGVLYQTDAMGAPHALDAESIALRSTGGATLRPHTLHAASTITESVRALEVWLPSQHTTQRFTASAARRADRVARMTTLAGPSARLATDARIAIRACVLAVGASIRHAFQGPSYVISTFGRIAIDGVVVEPAARAAILCGGSTSITALESTEVITIET
jgi:redox-sensitive bicupin YhaK (pirin superfamily)